MDPNSPIQALWSGPRIGSSRRGSVQQQSKPHSTASPPPAATASPAVTNPFTPHDLQLRPGDTVTGVPLGTHNNSSSSSSGYVLDSEVHRGPRSAVWRASDRDTHEPVVLKVLGLGSKQQQSAALRELDIMQQLTDRQPDDSSSSSSSSSSTAVPMETAAAADSGSRSSANSSSNRAVSHLVRLLGAFVLQQQQKASPSQSVGKTHHTQQQQEQQQQQGSSSDALLVSAAAAGDSSSSRSGVVLVMPQLYQSLSWVLHFVHQRNGRMGLPPAAVRSYAHQLLTALSQLHDSHAVVHRDVKPSNMLLQQPFVVRTDKKHMMRSMTLSELTTAQWTLVDFGNAACLQPPAQAAPVSQLPEADAPADSSHPSHQGSSTQLAPMQTSQQPQQQQQGQTLLLWFGQMMDRVLGKSTAVGSGIGSSRVAADTPSGRCWQVAAGDMPGYESVAYVPPEAILHCPATAAYDIWSAACSIFEAATGRTLFPVEAAAAARRCITDRVYRPSAADDDADETSTLLDEVHLALIKRVAGPPPAQVLAQSSVAEGLFFDSSTGRLWLSEEEEEAPELRGWRQAAAKPLLHHLMARRSMSLQQAIELAELLQPMLAWDPAERPTAAELLRNPYFKRLEEGDLIS